MVRRFEFDGLRTTAGFSGVLMSGTPTRFELGASDSVPRACTTLDPAGDSAAFFSLLLTASELDVGTMVVDALDGGSVRSLSSSRSATKIPDVATMAIAA